MSLTPPCISVVVPVYNEDENIEQCLRGLWAALLGCEHEILVCYDFDGDTTLGAIARMDSPPPSLRLVKNDLGRGAANALRAGFRAARGDVVVTTMADLSDPPEAIPLMAARMRETGAAVVSGSRYMAGGSQTGGPLVKRCLSQTACLSLKWIAGLGTHDATTNFRAYSRDWLAQVEVESRDAFDIALELTVKAHLAGERVAEVPSTWIDRVSGESRFRVLQWMPKYLRWYWKAAAEPLVVWAGLAVALLVALLAGGWTPEPSGADTVIVLLQAAIALGLVLSLRRMRGRMRATDALLPLAWLHPWHPDLLHAGLGWISLPAAVLVSAGLMAAACGRERSRAAARELPGLVLRHVRQSHLGLLLAAGLVWLTYFQKPDLLLEMGLDPAWQRAYSAFFLHRFQAGVDYVFTYGPLGFLEFGAYMPGTFWVDVLAWEILAKGLFALVLVAATTCMRGPLDKALYLVVLLVGSLSQDAYLFLTTLAVTLLVFRRPGLGRAWMAAAFGVLALLATIKFTVLVLSVACAAGISLAQGLPRGLRRDWPRAAGTFALWWLVFFLVWGFAAGQSPLNFIAYLRGAVPIASGYNQAMSVAVPLDLLVIGAAVGGLAALATALFVIRPPWNAGRALFGGLVLAACFLAFKTSYVRHGGSITFFAFAAPAILLLQWPRSEEATARRWGPPVLDAAATFARFACAAVALVFNPLASPATGNTPVMLVELWSQKIGRKLETVRELPGMERRLDHLYARLKEHVSLPLIRERIGGAAVDLLSVDQDIVLLNGFPWKPRPVFQSYSAYTPDLALRNAAHFEGDDAPPFVILSVSSIDERYPMMDDGAALQVLLRDYVPVLAERHLLLFERRPREAPLPERTVVLEREIAFGERVELPRTGGEVHVLSLDIRPSLRGKLLTQLLHTPQLRLQAGGGGQVFEGRIAAGMMRTGMLLDPLILGQAQLRSWLSGQQLPRIEWVRLLPDKRGCFAPEVGLRLERADELAPRPLDEAFERQLLYPMFKVKPSEIMGGQQHERLLLPDGMDALLVHSPSQITFEVGSGPHRLRALFGMLPDSYTEGWTDGVTFSVLAKRPGAPAKVLFQRHLDPLAVSADRGTQTFDMTIEHLPGPMQILLRTSSEDGTRDWAWWADVDMGPVGPEEVAIQGG